MEQVIKAVRVFESVAKPGAYLFSMCPVVMIQRCQRSERVFGDASIRFVWPAPHGFDVHAIGIARRFGELRITQPGQPDDRLADGKQMTCPALTVSGVQ